MKICLDKALPQSNLFRVYTPTAPQDSEYARLLVSLKLPLQYSHFSALSDILPETKMSLWSDCKRRGWILTEPALRAAAKAGINPGFLLCGESEPMYRMGYGMPEEPGQAPVKIV